MKLKPVEDDGTLREVDELMIPFEKMEDFGDFSTYKLPDGRGFEEYTHCGKILDSNEIMLDCGSKAACIASWVSAISSILPRWGKVYWRVRPILREHHDPLTQSTRYGVYARFFIEELEMK